MQGGFGVNYGRGVVNLRRLGVRGCVECRAFVSELHKKRRYARCASPFSELIRVMKKNWDYLRRRKIRASPPSPSRAAEEGSGTAVVTKSAPAPVILSGTCVA